MSAEELKAQLETSGVEKLSVCKDCGALVIHYQDGRIYNVTVDYFTRYFQMIDSDLFRNHYEEVAGSWYRCNHCAFHYGLDLCACDSGEFVDVCERGTGKCGKSVQVLGSHNCPRD